MAILINDNYSLQACKPFDARYLNICSPWTSVGAVNAAIPTYRYTGLTVNIMGTEYWYKDGILDTCLIPKVLGGGGTLTGATNGLSITDNKVKLGGNLLGPAIATEINIPTLSSFAVIYTGTTGGTLYLGPTAGYITNNNAGMCVFSDCIRLQSGSVIFDICNNKAEYDGFGTQGITYSQCLHSTYGSRSLVDKEYVDKKISGATSGITDTIIGATNGLTKVGQQVKLGGNLTGGTTINLNGQQLSLSGTTGMVLSKVGTSSSSYAYSCVSADYITLETQNSSNYAYIDLSRTGNTITSCAKGGNLLFSTDKCMIITTLSGASYAGCYHNNYTNRTLVDKEYVDNSQSVVNVRYTIPDVNPFYINATDNYVGVTGYTGIELGCIYLYATPKCGQKVTISDIQGQGLTYPITIDGNGKCINGNGCATINTDYGSITFIYNNLFWSAVAFVN